MRLSPKVKDLIFEISTTVLTLIVCSVVLFFAFLGFIYPFPTYIYFTGTVIYQNEIPVASEYNGIVLNVLANNNTSVNMDQPIISLSNRDNRNQSKTIEYEIQKAANQVEKSKQLAELGSLSPMVLKEQQLALEGLRFQQNLLISKYLRAPYSGQIYYIIPPQQLLGKFVQGGEVVGYIHQNDKKVLSIQANASEFTRFKLNSKVTLFPKDNSAKQRQMVGALVQKTIDRKTDQLHMIGEITEAYDDFKAYDPGSQINVGILVNNKSLFESFFDFDPYSIIRKKLDWPILDKIGKWIEWIQK